MLWRLRTGAPWRDLPERYGPWQTVYRRFAHSIVLSTGNTADCSMFPAVLDAIRIPRVGAGRPRTKPDRVVADKAYSSRKIRHLLQRRSIKATIPERRDQIANRARRASEGKASA